MYNTIHHDFAFHTPRFAGTVKDMIEDAEIGKNLTRFRAAAGLTQQRLGALMTQRGWKWSQTTVYNVEKGERPLRLREAEDVAHVVGVTVNDLVRPAPAGIHLARIQEDMKDLRADFHDAAEGIARFLNSRGMLETALSPDDLFGVAAPEGPEFAKVSEEGQRLLASTTTFDLLKKAVVQWVEEGPGQDNVAGWFEDQGGVESVTEDLTGVTTVEKWLAAAKCKNDDAE